MELMSAALAWFLKGQLPTCFGQPFKLFQTMAGGLKEAGSVLSFVDLT